MCSGGRTAAGAASLAGFGLGARAKATETKTLRFIAQSDLRVLDPIWTTAYITRNHGYMVFDTLFALDAEFAPHPQMVGSHDISSDKLSYVFTLRDGLKFHDGGRVRGIDCIASLRRWMVRDSFGQALATAIDEMTAAGDTSFTIRLREPFPLLIHALAKVSSLVPFIMPERLAETDPYQQVTEMVGSGPFKFVAEEFQPGHKVLYVKNPHYMPRDEPPSWASGGKVVKVDRVEWLYVPDAMTKAAALTAGEADWWENPPFDIHPLLSSNPDITLAKTDPFGGMGCLRFNHLRPPFDNVKMRQAVLAVADQADFMTVFAGDPKNWKVCPSFFTCGTPMASEVGSTALTGKRDFDRAKKLIAEAGYKGETIVVLDAVDQPNPHAHALVAAELLKKLGLNVEIAASDWGNLVIRRASKATIDKGGWNIFAPVRWAPTRSIRRSTRGCARMETRHGSAGRATTRSRRCGGNGSRPPTSKPAKRSRRGSKSAPLRSCPIFRPDNGWNDRISQEPQGADPRPHDLPVERGEGLGPL
jgi:peptide/nickel transport system substrate-binding protein